MSYSLVKSFKSFVVSSVDMVELTLVVEMRIVEGYYFLD